MKNVDTAGQKGYDGGKKISGIKRHIAVDVLGLPHSIHVTTDCQGDFIVVIFNKKYDFVP